jgi:predicted PurR-regulated permease PerM
MLFVEFLLTTALAAIMYASGERAAASLRRFGFRLAGQRGEQSVVLVGQAIRGVALGVVLTAVVQSAIGGLALAIAAVPLASILTALMFVMCVAQLGPGLVLFPAVAWTYWGGNAGWGTFLLVASVLVVTLDNFLRPILIKRGADLPLLLVLLGVIGGLIAFGLIGIFLGPAVLAVTYTLLQAWMAEDRGYPAGSES